MAAQQIGSATGGRGGKARCPKCGSEDVRMPKWNVLTGLLGVLLGAKATCGKCGHKWKP